MIYEFVTPSDTITFEANSDKTAYICAIYLGNGKALCHRYNEMNDQVDIPTGLFFVEEPGKAMQEYLECDPKEFMEKHKEEIAECFESFAYCSVEDRKTYNDAIEAITDREKLTEFKTKHEDRNRSSMSKWVQAAWKYAESIRSLGFGSG